MSSKTSKELAVLNLGRTRYRPVWDLQKSLVSVRAEDKIPDCLLITEHEPVLTMGRGTAGKNLLVSPEELARRGVDLHEIERGGDITFHGPGQAVLYPIIDLRERGRDLHKYLRDMEAFVIRALADLGLTAGIKEGLTGIWVDDHKVGAIGVAVSKWISYHGVAVNVTTDLEYFKLINPCGITQFPVGTVSQMLGRELKLEYFTDLLVHHFADYFGYSTNVVEDVDGFFASVGVEFNRS